MYASFLLLLISSWGVECIISCPFYARLWCGGYDVTVIVATAFPGLGVRLDVAIAEDEKRGRRLPSEP